LRRGDFAAQTTYDVDPVAAARSYARAGARHLHVVDLDAARTGQAHQLEVIRAICAGCAGAMTVQVGGGVRSVEAAEALLDAGADRVVVGTAVVTDPGLVAVLAGRFGSRIVVGLDVRGGRLAVRGWTEDSSEDLEPVLRRLPAVGAVVVTEIGRDGTLEGPDVDLYRRALGATALPVIASGGVGGPQDLRTLRDLWVGGRGLAGVIVGRALYEGRLDVADALRILAGG